MVLEALQSELRFEGVGWGEAGMYGHINTHSPRGMPAERREDRRGIIGIDNVCFPQSRVQP